MKSDAAGKFSIVQNPPGPRLLQSAYDGVTYAHMLPPGAPSTGVALDVYNSSKKPEAAEVGQHMVFFEPNAGKLTIDEMFVWNNTGKITFNDPDGGTLRFYAPTESKGIQVNCTAPRRHAHPKRAPAVAGQPDVFKIDCAIKPGETTIEVTYALPFNSPGTFDGKTFFKGGPTSLIAPEGVLLKGEGLEVRPPPPQFKGSIYQTTAAAYKVEIEAIKRPTATASQRLGTERAADFVCPAQALRQGDVGAHALVQHTGARVRAAVSFGATGFPRDKIRKEKMTEAVAAEDVWKYYGDYPALREIRLAIEPGSCSSPAGAQWRGQDNAAADYRRALKGWSRTGHYLRQGCARSGDAAACRRVLGHGISVYEELFSIRKTRCCSAGCMG